MFLMRKRYFVDQQVFSLFIYEILCSRLKERDSDTTIHKDKEMLSVNVS